MTSRPALLEELGLPAVVIGPHLDEVPRARQSSMGVDDAPGIRAAVEHLIGLGHTRIAHVSGPQHMVHGRSRREAWSNALKGAGLPEGPCMEADFSAESGARAMRALLDLRDRPTAVVFANDLMAMAGLSTAVSRGVVVPDDLSITGFDDVEICAHLQPSLTSVHTDVVAWGRAAATRLLAADRRRPRPQPRRTPGRTPRRALLHQSCTRPGTPPLNGATMKRTFLSTSAAVLALGDPRRVWRWLRLE